MRILVTGAAGFVGSHFAEAALVAGHAVTGLYRSDRAASRQQRIALLRARGARLVQGDILDESTMREAAAGAQCVCHVAAAFNEASADETQFQRVNVEGTATVLRAAAQAGARRIVLCSTAGIYGQRLAGVTDERSVPRPWNAYERSKLAGEQRLREEAARLGLEYAIVRPCAIYGPGDVRLEKLFRAAARGRFPLFGPGAGRRHLIYVADLAEALLRACTRPQAAGAELIVAGPHAVPLRELLESIAQCAGRRSFGPKLPLRPMLLLAAVTEDVCNRIGVNPPLYRRRMDFYLSDAAYDCTRAREVLGWQPRVSLGEGIERVLRSLPDASGPQSREPSAEVRMRP